MRVRIPGLIAAALTGITMALTWATTSGANTRPADATVAYTLIDVKPFDLPPNTATTREAIPVNGLLHVKPADTITHQWAEPTTGCAAPPRSPSPSPSTRPPTRPSAAPSSTPPTRPSAAPSPTPPTGHPTPTPSAVAAADDLTNTPANDHNTFWAEAGQDPAHTASVTGLLLVAAIATIWPYRRPRTRGKHAR